VAAYSHDGTAYVNSFNNPGVTAELPSNAIPDSGVFRLTFDDADTTGGSALDVWNNYDGTINGATTGVTGELGEAYDFDGTDDFVAIANDPALVFGDGSADSEFSLSAWINPDTATAFRILSKANSSGGTREYLFTITSGDVPALALYDDGGTLDNQLQKFGQTDFSALTGLWTHVAATYDGSGEASGVKVYVNGSEENYSVSEVGPEYTAMRDMGGSVDAGLLQDANSYADGRIDDPRLYSKELTNTEVSNLYNTGSISG